MIGCGNIQGDILEESNENLRMEILKLAKKTLEEQLGRIKEYCISNGMKSKDAENFINIFVKDPVLCGNIIKFKEELQKAEQLKNKPTRENFVNDLRKDVPPVSHEKSEPSKPSETNLSKDELGGEEEFYIMN